MKAYTGCMWLCDMPCQHVHNHSNRVDPAVEVITLWLCTAWYSGETRTVSVSLPAPHRRRLVEGWYLGQGLLGRGQGLPVGLGERWHHGTPVSGTGSSLLRSAIWAVGAAMLLLQQLVEALSAAADARPVLYSPTASSESLCGRIVCENTRNKNQGNVAPKMGMASAIGRSNVGDMYLPLLLRGLLCFQEVAMVLDANAADV